MDMGESGAVDVALPIAPIECVGVADSVPAGVMARSRSPSLTVIVTTAIAAMATAPTAQRRLHHRPVVEGAGPSAVAVAARAIAGASEASPAGASTTSRK